MAKAPFKMKGFGGFGNSPAKLFGSKKRKEQKRLQQEREDTITTHLDTLPSDPIFDSSSDEEKREKAEEMLY